MHCATALLGCCNDVAWGSVEGGVGCERAECLERERTATMQRMQEGEREDERCILRIENVAESENPRCGRGATGEKAG